jgi:hypothetical protein
MASLPHLRPRRISLRLFLFASNPEQNLSGLDGFLQQGQAFDTARRNHGLPHDSSGVSCPHPYQLVPRLGARPPQLAAFGPFGMLAGW